MTGRRKTDLAWAAGMFDGEGALQAKRRRQIVNGQEYENFTIHATITNTHKPSIDKLFEIFGGGYVGQRIAGSGKPIWRIEWSARKAMKVLQEIAPYSVTKQAQIQAALAFRKLIVKRGAYGPKRRPPEVWTAMEQLANSVNTLRLRKAIPSQAAEAV